MKKPSRTTQSEKQLCSSIVDALNYQGCYVWRVNSGAMKYEYKGKVGIVRMARAGTSDILGIHRDTGRFIAIEVKLPHRRKYVTQAQQEFIDKINMYGGIAGVATSPEEALEIIELSTTHTGEGI